MHAYCFVNPTGSRLNGLGAYVQGAVSALNSAGIEARMMECSLGTDESRRAKVEEEVMDQIHASELVELPDSRGLFLGSHLAARAHVRLHGPILYLSFLNHQRLDYERSMRELTLARNARFVSSPSRANLEKYLECGLRTSAAALLFPNAVPEMVDVRATHRDVDLLFLGRGERVKGLDLFLELAAGMPSDARVVIAGSPKPPIELNDIRCSIEWVGPVDADRRALLLRRTRVCVVPSRFESFSMVVAEAITAGCQVVAWRIGGIPEIFPEPLVHFATPFDTQELTSLALKLLEAGSHDLESAANFVRDTNASYVAAVRAVLQAAGEPLGSKKTHALHYEALYSRTFQQRWQRKLHKLIRDPRRFVLDAIATHT